MYLQVSADGPEKSATSKVIPAPPYFEAIYGRLKFKGQYVIDDLTVSTGNIKQAEFGIVHEGTGPGERGILGLGFDSAEFGPNKTFKYVYPDILDSLYNESIIDSRAFDLHLNQGGTMEIGARGSLVLGGYDKSGFSGPLETFAIESPSDVQRLGAPLASISAVISGVTVPIWLAASDGNVNTTFIPAVLDSGDMLAQFPAKSLAGLIAQLNRYEKGMLKKWKPGNKFDPTMDCCHSSANISIDFTFANSKASITISVPFSELVLPFPWDQDCAFALRPKSKESGKPYWLNLGSSIVGSTYLIVDYDKNTIGIAKAQHDGRQAEIVPISNRPGDSI